MRSRNTQNIKEKQGFPSRLLFLSFISEGNITLYFKTFENDQKGRKGEFLAQNVIVVQTLDSVYLTIRFSKLL